MIIIGDIGNTEIKICLYDNKYNLIKRISFKTKVIKKKIISNKLSFLKNKELKITKIIFSSVVPSAFKQINNFFVKNIKKKCTELKNLNLSQFIKIKVNKKQIGSDRLANAISINDNKKNYIVLDFGTATTFDVVVQNKYIGGIIAPGVQLSLNTLISSASLIPNINLLKVSKIIGKNTKSAVRSGFYWGYSGLIENIIKLIIKQTRQKYHVVLTGGFAYLFKDSIKNKVRIDKDLTIKGLLKVAKNLK